MKKINENLLLSVLVIILFFFTFNAYAAEDDNENLIDITKAHESTIETVNTANEVEDVDEYNSARSQAVSATTTVSNAIIFIAPELTTGGDDIEASSSITSDMKRGLYGMVEDGVYAMYESQPYVNVYAHLAEEWVPGYEESSAVYAETETGPYDSGYTELINSGIVGLWTQVRNIAYVFFIVIFIIVGFMIMFRSKIGGQTLITLGNSLPNVILALIGVTFSFAIAGLIIDVGGLIMLILVDVFEGASNIENLVTLESLGSVFQTFGDLVDSSGDVTTGFLSLIGGSWKSGLTMIIALVTGPIGLVGLILILAMLGIITVGVFKVFISLIKAYLGILLGVVTGPIQIAISAIPGKGPGFMNWILSIFRNVLVYPVTFALLNVSRVLYAVNNEGGISLPGPDKLTLPQTTNQATESFDLISGVMIFILQVLILFAASNAGKYVQAIIPPKASRQGDAAVTALKGSLQGIPLIGKLIK